MQHTMQPLALESLAAQSPWRQDPGRLPSLPSNCLPRHLGKLIAANLASGNGGGWHQVVSGPRRAGKTTLLYQVIHEMMEAGVSPKRIHYATMDHAPLKGQSLLDIIGVLTHESGATPEEPAFLFLDEIAYAEDWDIALKNSYDLPHMYPAKIVAASSSALHLKQGHMESGAGRWEQFYLMPMSFAEHLTLGGIASPELPQGVPLAEKLDFFAEGQEPDQSIQKALAVFVLAGGMPLEIDRSDLASVESRHGEIQNTLRVLSEKIVYQDITSVSGVRDPVKLADLLQLLADRPSGVMSKRNITSTLATSENTVNSYMSHLENSLVVFTLQQYAANLKRATRKPKKASFWDVAMPAALRNRTSREILRTEQYGWSLENIAAAALNELVLQAISGAQVHHWRQDDNYEVDLVFTEAGSEPLALEIAGSFTHSTRGLNEFLAKHPNFAGRAYLVAPDAPVSHRKPVGTLPLGEFLLAANSRTNEMLRRRFAG